MDRKHFEYYTNHESKTFNGEFKEITYSFNDSIRTIIGFMEERNNLIYLYEYRGKYVGTEFFISFTPNSSSYKLIKVEDAKP